MLQMHTNECVSNIYPRIRFDMFNDDCIFPLLIGVRHHRSHQLFLQVRPKLLHNHNESRFPFVKPRPCLDAHNIDMQPEHHVFLENPSLREKSSQQHRASLQYRSLFPISFTCTAADNQQLFLFKAVCSWNSYKSSRNWFSPTSQAHLKM